MNEDLQHLRYLSIFHYVVAALVLVTNLFPLLWLAMGIGMVTGRLEPESPSPEDVWFGWIWVAFSVGWFLAGLVFAACLVLAGRYLRRQRRYLFCLVMGAVQTMFFPVGTALGIFTILVLMRDSVKALFGVAGEAAAVVETGSGHHVSGEAAPGGDSG